MKSARVVISKFLVKCSQKTRVTCAKIASDSMLLDESIGESAFRVRGSFRLLIYIKLKLFCTVCSCYWLNI